MYNTIRQVRELHHPVQEMSQIIVAGFSIAIENLHNLNIRIHQIKITMTLPEKDVVDWHPG